MELNKKKRQQLGMELGRISLLVDMISRLKTRGSFRLLEGLLVPKDVI